MNSYFRVITEDFPEIKFILGQNKARYPFSNSLLVDDILIDTGCSSKIIRKTKKRFPINKVILTHWHEDHIHGNNKLKKCDFICHKADKNIIENIELMYNFYRIKNTSMERQFREALEFFNLENTKINNVVNDGDKITINENLTLKILHTPGHTAGHLSLIEETSRIAFLGDIDLTSFMFYGSEDANLQDFEVSLDKLLELDINFAASGHNKLMIGRKEIKESLKKYKSIIFRRDKAILALLKEFEPRSLEEFLGKNLIYPQYSNFKDYEVIAEKVMIEKHLEKLINDNIIIKEADGFYLN